MLSDEKKRELEAEYAKKETELKDLFHVFMVVQENYFLKMKK